MNTTLIRSNALTSLDLQEWIHRYGGYHMIDWKAWDRARAAFMSAHRAGLAPAPTAKGA